MRLATALVAFVLVGAGVVAAQSGGHPHIADLAPGYTIPANRLSPLCNHANGKRNLDPVTWNGQPRIAALFPPPSVRSASSTRPRRTWSPSSATRTCPRG